MTTTFSTLLYDKSADGLAWITLNRPQRLNAISAQSRDDLWELLHAVADDPNVRAVGFGGAVLRGLWLRNQRSGYGVDVRKRPLPVDRRAVGN